MRGAAPPQRHRDGGSTLRRGTDAAAAGDVREKSDLQDRRRGRLRLRGILRLIEHGKLDTTPLITHRFPLSEIEEAYRIFENRLDGVIKVAITADPSKT